MGRGLPLTVNNDPVLDNRFALSAEKTIEFDGGTANAIGDHDGTGDPFNIFTVTGTVAMRILAVCEDTLVGASATLEVGTALSTAGLIALTTAANIAVNEIWHDTTPDASIEAVSVLNERIVNQDVIGTVKTANITAGQIKFIAYWYPLSDDGNVVAA